MGLAVLGFDSFCQNVATLWLKDHTIIAIRL
jgi:hypothetical protein